MEESPPSAQSGLNPFAADEQTYGQLYKKHLMEQYKLCVEMADRVSSRRSTTNNFFLTLNSLLITAIGILSRIGISGNSFNLTWVIIASFAGILFCWCWFTTINGYRTLNSSKFEIINSIEKKLPVAAFETEWKHLTPKDGKVKHRQLTKVECWIPKIFSLLYLTLSIFAILSVFFPVV
jgi:hypothetical protein